MKTEDVANRVEELLLKLKNKKFKQELINGLTAEKRKCGDKSKTSSQNFKIIAEVIKDEFSNYDISETTVYRLIKIYEKDRRLYADIANGKIKIKTAYQKLYKPKQIHKKKTVAENNDFYDIYIELKCLNERLEQLDLDNDAPINVLKDIDNEVFKFRKSLGKRIVYKESN